MPKRPKHFRPKRDGVRTDAELDYAMQLLREFVDPAGDAVESDITIDKVQSGLKSGKTGVVMGRGHGLQTERARRIRQKLQRRLEAQTGHSRLVDSK